MTRLPPPAYQLAQRDALRAACDRRMPTEAMALLALPTAARSGTLRFLVSLWDHGDPPRVTRPWIAVDVPVSPEGSVELDVELPADGSLPTDVSLPSATGHPATAGSIVADWDGEPAATDWLCRYRSEAALALHPAALGALEVAYCGLVVEVAGPDPTGDATRRLTELFTFLVPGELHAWYRRASPDLVAAMEDAVGSSLGHREEPPDWVDLPDRPVAWLDDLVVPGDRDRILTNDEVSHALRALELRPGDHSPLVGLPAPGSSTGDPGSDGRTPEWRRALATLCAPAFHVELVGCDGRAWARVSTYVRGTGDDESWVVHDTDDERHLIGFPRDPDEILALTDHFLPAFDPAIQGDRLDLSLSECAVLFGLVDAHHDAGPGAASKLGWASAGALLVPLGLQPPESAGGLDGLVRAGWIATRPDSVALTEQGRGIVDALGRPTATVALRAIEFANGSRCSHTCGFVAVSTATRVWLCGIAEEWGCETPPDDPRVAMVSVRPDEVLRAGAQVLDLR